MKNISKNVLLTIFIILLYSTHVLACSCAPPRDAKTSLELSKAVFKGKVIEISKFGKFKLKVRFDVEKNWKGPLNKQIEVITESTGASCGYNFVENENYIVYAHKDDPLLVSLCSRTTRLVNAGEDLNDLGEGQLPILGELYSVKTPPSWLPYDINLTQLMGFTVSFAICFTVFFVWFRKMT